MVSLSKILCEVIYSAQPTQHHLYIYKSGDPNDCNNYRGISVTSCLGKLFTSLLQKRLLVLTKVDSEVAIEQLIIFTY
jgi:hypothetical protein